MDSWVAVGDGPTSSSSFSVAVRMFLSILEGAGESSVLESYKSKP